jgi:hypothetical protein
MRSLLLLVFTVFSSIGLPLLSAQRVSTGADVSRWRALQPDIERALAKDLIWIDCRQQERAIQITQAADITGNGAPDAVVEYCHAGAYTSNAVVMRLLDGKPVIARFKEENGRVDNGAFLEGASVMHGEHVSLLPDEHAVYAIHWDTDSQGELSVCAVRAFAWVEKTGTFEWNAAVGSGVSGRECQKLQKELHQDAAPFEKQKSQ